MHPIVSVTDEDGFLLVNCCISVFNTSLYNIKKNLCCLVMVQPSSVRNVRIQNDILYTSVVKRPYDVLAIFYSISTSRPEDGLADKRRNILSLL